jgi:hypothetical protein
MVSSMSLFEKIEPEEIVATQETLEIPQSSRTWANETFVVEYSWSKKIVALLCSFFVLLMFKVFLEEALFVLEVFMVVGFVAGIWYLSDLILTRNITFTPHKIVKNGYISQTEIRTDELVLDVNEQNIHFFHATEKNIREAVKVRRVMISIDDCADILKYAADVYKVSAKKKTVTSSGSKNKAGSLAAVEYHKAVSAYLMTTAFFIVWSLIALFTAGLASKFYGLTPELPAFAIRLTFIFIAIACFFVQKRLSSTSAVNSKGTPLEMRLKQAEHASFLNSVISNGVVLLGLLLFLMFGNLLDFYMFLLVGILYYFDFYPRFSLWEMAVHDYAAVPAVEVSLPRRRSIQVSLVLMGALAVTSYGENQHYLYSTRKDCVDDWGDGKDCREVPHGSGGHYSGTRYYGPRYGSGGGTSTRSIGVGSISRGGFGSLGSFHGSFGG